MVSSSELIGSDESFLHHSLNLKDIQLNDSVREPKLLREIEINSQAFQIKQVKDQMLYQNQASEEKSEESQLEESADASILVVDDCPLNQLAIKSLLRQSSQSFESCEDGEKAVEMVKKRVASGKCMYQLILMDFSMPVCDGPTATREIKGYLSTNLPSQQPFICCLTAYTDQSFINAAMEAGSDDFATKPINGDRLK